jgi:integrase
MEMRTINDGPLPQHFPLGLASNGQFCKKFQGRRWQFGAESGGWKAALAKWQHDWPFILQGKLPPPMTVEGEPDPATLEYIATKFVEREEKRRRRNEIKGGSFTDIRNAVEIAVTHLGKSGRPAHLLPDDFADLREALSFTWAKQGERWVKGEGRVSPAVLGRRIVHVRAMFNWAGPDGAKLLGASPAYGDSFGLVSDATKQKAVNNRERKHGAKRWEVSEIEPIFNGCEAQLQAMFLLSINCGFTAADCSALPWWAVDLDKALIDFARVKTGVDRLRLPLWPETVAALREVRKLGLSPAPGLADLIVHQDRGDNGEAVGDPIRLTDCVFITAKGRPWVTRVVKLDANKLPVSESHKDSVALEFNKVLTGLKVKRVGVGFGAGRHTFETHAMRCGDAGMVDRVMGHSNGRMGRKYDHATDDDMAAMMNGVRDRLIRGKMRLPDAKQGAEVAAAPATMRLVS